MPFGSNPFLSFLEDRPEVAFQAMMPQGGSPASQRFFQNQFQNIHGRFLGQLGQQILQGQAPTLQFTDFLRDFNFGGHAAATPPWLRGAQTQRFAPQTRFMLF
jgi:hypothetical protein